MHTSNLPYVLTAFYAFFCALELENQQEQQEVRSLPPWVCSTFGKTNQK
jgi:hypothetical protein